MRLAWVEYLIHQTGFKRTRIGFENPVKGRHPENAMRADLILYTSGMKPYVLVECKSETVSLNKNAAGQAARYNQTVNAPYIVLTNGVEDFWFLSKDGNVKPVTNQLNEMNTHEAEWRKSGYWAERGFLKDSENSDLNTWLTKALNLFWSDEFAGDKRYLAFDQSVLPLPMSQYYKVVSAGEGIKTAITFIGNRDSEQYLVAVINKHGQNSGVLAVELENFLSGKNRSVTIFRDGKKMEYDAELHLPISLEIFHKNDFKKLPQLLMNFFV